MEYLSETFYSLKILKSSIFNLVQHIANKALVFIQFTSDTQGRVCLIFSLSSLFTGILDGRNLFICFELSPIIFYSQTKDAVFSTYYYWYFIILHYYYIIVINIIILINFLWIFCNLKFKNLKMNFPISIKLYIIKLFW